jgi:type VI secretion system protein VasG
VESQSELDSLLSRWEQEKSLVSRINAVRRELEASISAADEVKPDDDAVQRGRRQLVEIQQELSALQGEEPLVHVCVDGAAVAAIVGAWTGIPVGRMLSDEVSAVLSLQERMQEAVVGQSHALRAIAESIHISRANLTDPSRPIGVFLLAGTSGVGKTETAITLANLLYGGEQNMTTINMSEFKEEHKVSLLMGSPPGYVGYGEGGVLTEAVRRKPYSVVLLDEMEKAHPGVQDVFYQVFDKGTMKDGEGRDIDFKNTLILMTTNAGTELIKSLCLDPETRPDAETLAGTLHDELMKSFKPAFLGRLTVVPYFPLTDDVLERIVRLKLNKIRRRVRESYNAAMNYDDEVVRHFVSRCNAVDTGARAIDHLLTRNVLPEMSREFLNRVARRDVIQSMTLVVEDENRLVFRCE